MSDIFSNYLQSVSEKFRHKETSEIGYRTDFEQMLKKVFEGFTNIRINHDSRTVDGNKPDFIVIKNEIPLLYIEAKDVGISLDKIEKSEQMTRYFGYANLILTDYVEFRFYRNGLKYEEPIKIAQYDLKKRTVRTIPENFEHLKKSIVDFTQTHKEPIRSAEHLSKIMGGKAQRIRDNVRYFLSTDSKKNKPLLKLYDTLKKMLVHDLTHNAFADLYAQTLVYGLFVARYHDETPENFNRLEARELVPKSNPLLRHFFDHILGTDYDERLKYIVDELCEVFSHADVPKLMKQYFKDDLWGNTHDGPDPVIHFYEDFLKEYDPELRKKMGAYYTPLPVVRFIVRAVDHMLQKDFGLANGLADTTKLENGKHKVQVLDPATGTGTFITEIFRNIYSKFEGQKGRWPKYVLNDLLPRVHGFELMMAPYTISHLKLSMFLKETGFKYFNNERLGIYLTNSLEEGDEIGDLFGGVGFAESIAQESKDAAKIKNETPIMVIVGNPPYNVNSNNKSKWILKLIEIYKENLNEKKINLDDDYIKFIRFAEYFIDKNKTGIVAMITNNSFIDGDTHRQMRKHLLETFDEIYILDLHGNTKKKEKASDGSNDENVFDITQGVSINIFVKKNRSKENLGKVFHANIFGKRLHKFDILNSATIVNTKWVEVNYESPKFYFVPKDFTHKDSYTSGFLINELFSLYSSGIESAKDDFIIKFTENDINNLKLILEEKNIDEISEKFNIKPDKILQVKNDYDKILNPHTKFLYRPFDERFTIYSENSQGVWWRPRFKVMQHLLKNNLALLTCKRQTSFNFQHIFVTKLIAERCAVSLQTGEVCYELPLYYFDENLNAFPNLEPGILKKIEKIVAQITPEQILDYIYAVLYSPSYREKYKEFLKIDFPRVPYPKDKKTFSSLVKLGTELRELHLMESSKLNKFITTYPVEGNDTVEKISYKNGNVYINTDQYFGKVPEIAWNFYIGGYQPAQKWLKDRKGRTLTNEDIEHYQKIIIALTETGKIMEEIDKYTKDWI